MKFAWLLVVVCGAMAQTPPARFEAASIRLSGDPPEAASGIRTINGRMMAHNVTLKRCLMGAYGVGPNRIEGGPLWMDSERFDINAKAEGNAGDAELMKLLQELLADRFQVRLRRETRTMPVMLLEVGKSAPKLERAPDDAESSTNSGRGRIDAKGTTMAVLAEVLSRQTDTPVLDRTGIAGKYNLKLEWTLEREAATGTGPSLYTAIGEQLGLRLRADKAPLEVLVVDRAERPSEN